METYFVFLHCRIYSSGSGPDLENYFLNRNTIATKSISRCCASKKMSVYLGENTQVIEIFEYI